MARVELQPLPPEEAIRYFRAKGARIEQQYHWADWDARAHGTAFTVAKSTQADVARDIYDALLDNLEGGRTYEQFRETITPKLQAKGWWGRAPAVDPLTGKSQVVQLGSDRRLRIIYDTNIRMAHAQGQWERIQRRAAAAPWLRYVAVLDERTRKSHRDWHGTILKHDHVWWQTHLPPNGWRCRCMVQQLSDRDLARRGLTPSEGPPPGGTTEWKNPRTGETTSVPDGIDRGFAHNVGLVSAEAHAAQFFMDSAGHLPPAAATAVSRASAERVLPALLRDFVEFAEDAATAPRPRNQRRTAGVMSPQVEAALLKEFGIEVRTAALSVRDREIGHALRLAKEKKKTAVPRGLVLQLPEILARPQAVLISKQARSISYAVPVPGDHRLAVFQFQPNFREKGVDLDGHRRRLTLTDLRTSGMVAPEILKNRDLYLLVEGNL